MKTLTQTKSNPAMPVRPPELQKQIDAITAYENRGPKEEPAPPVFQGRSPVSPVKPPVRQFTFCGTEVPRRVKSSTQKPCQCEVRLVPITPVRAGGPKRVKSSTWPPHSGRADAQGESGKQRLSEQGEGKWKTQREASAPKAVGAKRGQQPSSCEPSMSEGQPRREITDKSQ